MGRFARAAEQLARRGGFVRPPPAALSAHEFSFTGMDGQPLPLARFAGRLLLVVNTASRCGFTPQYKGLQRLWRSYESRGLTVLGVPSNDFGGQEPGQDAEIQKFCQAGFGVDFPLTSKTVVSGPAAHPFYRWASAKLGPQSKPRWNFHKFLVSPDGQMIDWFSTVTPPGAERLVKAVEAHLP